MTSRRNAVLNVLLLTAMIAGCNPGTASTATPTQDATQKDSAAQTATAEQAAKTPRMVEYYTLPAPDGAQLRLGSGAYADLALSPDGEWLAAASTAAVAMYSTEDFSRRWVYSPDRTPDRIVYAPNGNFVAAYLRPGRIVLLDAEDGAVLRTIEVRINYVTGFDISPDGKQLAVTGRDLPPTILDVSTGEVVKQYEIIDKAAQVIGSAPDTGAYTGYDLYETAIAFSPDGKTLAVGQSLTGLLFFDLTTGTSRIIPMPDVGVARIAYSPDSRLVAVTPYDYDGAIGIWSASSGDRQCEWKTEKSSIGRDSLAFSPDGKRLAIAGEFGKARLINSADCSNVWGSSVWNTRGLAFSPDGETLYSGNISGVTAVDTRNGTVQADLTGLEGALEDAAIEPDLSAIYTAYGLYYRWNRISATEYEKELMVNTDGGWLIDSAPGSGLLATAGYIPYDRQSPQGEASSTAYVKDLTAGGKSRSLGDFPQIQTIELSPDGGSLALGTFSGHMILVDTRDGSQRLDLSLPAEGSGNPPGVTDIAFSPDGRFLVFVSMFSKELALWDASTGEKIRPLVDITGSPWSGYTDVAFSADGKILAARSDRHAIVLFDMSTGKSYTSLPETCESGGLNQKRSRRMDYRPDGILAVGCEDGLIEIFGSDGTLIETRKGHAGSVVSVRWAGDGKTLVSAAEDSTVILWNPLDAATPPSGEAAEPQPAAGVTMREIRMEPIVGSDEIEIGVRWYVEVTNNTDDWISGAPNLNITLYDEWGDVLIQDDRYSESRYPIPSKESILDVYGYYYPDEVEESGFTIGEYDLFLDPPHPWGGISSAFHPGEYGDSRVPWLELTIVQAGIRDIGWGSKEFYGTVRNDNAETCYEPIVFGYLYNKPDSHIEDIDSYVGNRKELGPGEKLEIAPGKTASFSDSIYHTELLKPNTAYKIWGLCLGQ